MDEFSVTSAALVLRSATSTMSERITALRFLKSYLEEDKNLDYYNKKKIKQLILDNVLKMILSEDKVTNMVKRQLIRTELFLILAKFLGSNALFGNINELENTIELSDDNDGDNIPYSLNSRGIVPDSKFLQSDTSYLVERKSNKTSGFKIKSESLPSSDISIEGNNSYGTSGSSKQVTASLTNKTINHLNGNNKTEITLLKPLITKHALKRLQSKILKPRPSVLYQDRMHSNSIVPGVDPLNYIEQDKKLGYQKSRMWFPGSEVTLQANMLPTERQQVTTEISRSEQVVKEYLQMRALTSYVGDLIAPLEEPYMKYNSNNNSSDQNHSTIHNKKSNNTLIDATGSKVSSQLAKTIGSSRSGSTNSNNRSASQYDEFYNNTFPPVGPEQLQQQQRISRLAGITDYARFNEALKEVAAVWSPLLGIHLPPSAATMSYRKHLHKLQSTGQQQHIRSKTSYSQSSRSYAKIKSVEEESSNLSTTAGSRSSNSSMTILEHDYQEIVPFKCLRVKGRMKKSRRSNKNEDDPEDACYRHNNNNNNNKSNNITEDDYGSDYCNNNNSDDDGGYFCDHAAACDTDFYSPSKRVSSINSVNSLHSPILTPQRQRQKYNDNGDKTDITTSTTNYYYKRTKQYQLEVDKYLQFQKESIAASIRASEAMIQSLIRSQYTRMQPTYLLLLEGNKAQSRQLIANMVGIFCRVKRLNYISLAFGIWRISLVLHASLARRPLYAKVASCHLMSRWYIEVQISKMKHWVYRWRRRAAMILFNERWRYSVLIQKQYRTWRDRRKLIQMHEAKPYLGILSDIYLAPKRASLTQYFIPDVIRRERRLLWLAATKLQTAYRCWITGRDYFYRRRQLLLVQSICRMWPIYRRYKRLKATTIRCQAWARRTVKKKQYRRLKFATIIVQKYTRRYLSILLKYRKLNIIWRIAARPLSAAIKIQCRWRIRIAHRKRKAKLFQVEMRKWAALVIQRNYYRYKRAYHTFFLMCALRERESQDIAFLKMITARGRAASAKILQRFYRARFFRIVISSTIKVQCWFRGRMGYNLVDVLRKERWASRKIRHWIQVRVRRWHKLARKIQRWWWRLGDKPTKQHHRKGATTTTATQQGGGGYGRTAAAHHGYHSKLLDAVHSDASDAPPPMGRLLKHLWNRARLLDISRDEKEKEAHYHAASHIQAYVKGVWDRRWVVRHRAALRIQKVVRSYFALKRLRRRKKDRNTKAVQAFVGKIIERALTRRVAEVLKKHSRMLCKPHAVIRGYLVRLQFARARENARIFSLAVVLIQRFWRTSCAIAAAREKVMALHRQRTNPFIGCYCLHDVLLMMRKQCANYYSAFDPRVGLRISSLLYRLGCSDLLDMFPKKRYIYVADMSKLTLPKLSEMHAVWRDRQKGGANLRGGGDDKQQQQLRRGKVVPTAQLENLIHIAAPPLFSKDTRTQERIQFQLMTPPEYCSPADMMEVVRKAYLKKFGKHLHARAEHLANDIYQLLWNNFNNYKTIGNVITRTQILKAISNASESTNVMQCLSELRHRSSSNNAAGMIVADERKWDKLRLMKCTEILQLAIDRAVVLLPAECTTLRSLVDKASARVISYRRKLAFARTKLSTSATHGTRSTLAKKRLVELPDESVPSSSSNVIVNNGVTTNNDKSTDGVIPTGEQQQQQLSSAIDEKKEQRMVQIITVSQSLDLPFMGSSEDELDMEYCVSVCKIYCEVLDKLYIASSGVQLLKAAWTSNALKRQIAQDKIKLFLSTATRDYIVDRHTDKVKVIWNKYRRMELAQQKFKIILQTVRERRITTDYELSVLPKYGWACYEDDNGYPYWVDNYPYSREESTYTMPTYTYAQYLALVTIQRLAKKYIAGAPARKARREELARAEAERLEALMQEERRLGRKQMHITLSVFSRVLSSRSSNNGNKSKKQHLATSSSSSNSSSSSATTSGSATGPESSTNNNNNNCLLPTLESLLPWKYRFEEHSIFTTGTWALYKTNSNSNNKTKTVGATKTNYYSNYGRQNNADSTTSATIQSVTSAAVSAAQEYEIVIVFRMNENDGTCDVRNVKGKCIRNVKISKLIQMNLDTGTAVETRYKLQKVFYRSVITSINVMSGKQPMYTVRYEDGEIVSGLQRDAIRPSLATLKHFLAQREVLQYSARLQLRRLTHYAGLKTQRIRSKQSSHHSLAVITAKEAAAVAANSADVDDASIEDGGGGSLSSGFNSSITSIGVMTNMLYGGGGDTIDHTTANYYDTGSLEGGSITERGPLLSSSVTTSQQRRAATAIPRFRIDIKVHLTYVRQCARYGWKLMQGTKPDADKGIEESKQRKKRPAPVRRGANPGSNRNKTKEVVTTYYLNQFTNEVVDDKPMYSGLEVENVKRIQRAWLAHQAHKRVLRKVLSYDIVQLIQDAVKKGTKIAYIGYEMEGVTSMQLLCRAGYWELTEVIDGHYKALKQQQAQQPTLQLQQPLIDPATLTIEDIAQKPKEEWEQIGVMQTLHVRDMREFQAWWNRANNNEKQKRLSFLNYFTGPQDPRTIQECIRDAEELLLNKFLKMLKTGGARTKTAVQMITSDAYFPHSHLQVDNYLRKYADKADIARDNVYELVNKYTTNTWVEERQVLRLYLNTVRVIGAILGIFKLQQLRKLLSEAEAECNTIMDGVSDDNSRLLCTGPEAKAALLLRKGVFNYFTKFINSIVVVQCKVRSYLLSKRWKIHRAARVVSREVLQKYSRRFLAYCTARRLRAQKTAQWEQLWDSKRNLLYYYNINTGVSQYEEPERGTAPYRPLVRDPLSAALMQAWPDITDRMQGREATAPPLLLTASTSRIGTTMSAASSTVAFTSRSHALCGICNTRKCVRICQECTDEVNFDPAKHNAFPYCFPCFMKNHTDENELRANHQFIVTVDTVPDISLQQEDTYIAVASTTNVVADSITTHLCCCMCNEPATRKCLGLFDENKIDEICNDLKKTNPLLWMNVLKAANVGGDSKLTMLLEQVRSEYNNSTANQVDKIKIADNGSISALSVAHIEGVRSILERARSECDECYCADCYADVHAGGKRAMHKWKGFKAYADRCSVCTNSPSDLHCMDCECQYCTSCYRVFHGMGRKRLHKKERVIEILDPGAQYCAICYRRAGTIICTNSGCGVATCDSCYTFKHQPVCDRDHKMSNRDREQHSSAYIPEGGCVVCGEFADKRCLQCGDCYCSRIFLEGDGCFAQHHSKGNRKSHTTEPYFINPSTLLKKKKPQSQ